MKKTLIVFVLIIGLLVISTIAAAADANIEIFLDQTTFVNNTGAESVPFPDSATVLSLTPWGTAHTDYSCELKNVGITLGTGDVVIKAPLASTWICFIGAGWDAPLSNTDPKPISPTIVANGEDDYHVVEFENPVYAVGFGLLTNYSASETITLTFTDGSTKVINDGELGTAVNSFEFVGFRSDKPIISVGIDTTGGASQNEGIVAIWVNDALLTRNAGDCTHGAYAGYDYVETLFVSAIGPYTATPILSSTSLNPDAGYKIETSGVYYAGGRSKFDIRADAEYAQDAYERANDLPWNDFVRGYVGYGEGLLELKVDGGFVEWGAFNNNHVYTMDMSGTGLPASFEYQVYDVYAQNNTGGLCVSLFENEPPIADPNGPYLGAIDTPIIFDGTGSYDPEGGDVTYAWDFGDGSTGTGATPNHTYAEPELYDVCLTVNDGTFDSATGCTIAVVYDPAAGFVTGGGWFESPAGAYLPDPNLTGNATFGFVSKYKKGATVPTGNTEFQFHTADLNFHSSTYDWLIVTGSEYAKFKGTGAINGRGEYKFMIWAGDNDPDTFRIKIWEEVEGVETVIYDNGSDQAINSGSIIIHTGKK